ncbi:DUF2182 domain-containing protein [Dyella sp. GSA-30]|uniref:DUF2182 domain-containing protein n=1 Tax=Dyella sp. GSA-30 TaxID=2994496 RepID=UPI00249183E1|nr:DUF2182 domain-containing protein [Dyella sp. GSA-30]
MFWAACVLLFAASTAVTIAGCTAMSGMGTMPMPGEWTMSMTWMPMSGQGWPALAASFLGMWTAMMAAMMLPSLMPVLWRYRGLHSNRLAALVGMGYFLVWIVLGVVVFLLGAGFAALAMHQSTVSRVVPVATGVVVAMAGALQFTAWKAHLLACCRDVPACARDMPTNAGSAWRDGLRRGIHCCLCCAGFTAVLVVNGVMDLGVMAAVTVAITVERLWPAGMRVARAVGVIVMAAGFGLIVRGVG